LKPGTPWERRIVISALFNNQPLGCLLQGVDDSFLKKTFDSDEQIGMQYPEFFVRNMKGKVKVKTREKEREKLDSGYRTLCHE